MSADVMTPGGAVAEAAAPSAGKVFSPLVVAARFVAPVLDRLGQDCLSVLVSDPRIEVEGPAREDEWRTELHVIEVRVHAYGVQRAAYVAGLLGLPAPTCRTVESEYFGPRTRVEWSGFVAADGASLPLLVEVSASARPGSVSADDLDSCGDEEVA